MSLESFNTFNTDDGNDVLDASVEDFKWHIDVDGYWDSVDERFYGEDTPNEPPLMNVPVKLAADIEYIHDSTHATDVAEQLDFNTPERYGGVVRITFNDFSTWNWPVLTKDGKPTSEVEHFIDEYIPQIIQWEAIVNGDDPNKALNEWKDGNEPDESWMSDVGNTEMSEKTREYFNENADWLSHISKSMGSIGVEIEEDDSWEDDW